MVTSNLSVKIKVMIIKNDLRRKMDEHSGKNDQVRKYEMNESKLKKQ